MDKRFRPLLFGKSMILMKRRPPGTWQPQRSILRQNVTCIKFVEDGEALIGGTSDGVLWYCQVPNGTLRAYAFLKSKVLVNVARIRSSTS